MTDRETVEKMSRVFARHGEDDLWYYERCGKTHFIYWERNIDDQTRLRRKLNSFDSTVHLWSWESVYETRDPKTVRRFYEVAEKIV